MRDVRQREFVCIRTLGELLVPIDDPVERYVDEESGRPAQPLPPHRLIASSACPSATPPACSRRPRLRPVVQLFYAICTPGKKKIALAEDVGGEILLDHMSLVAAANDEIPDAVEGGSRVS